MPCDIFNYRLQKLCNSFIVDWVVYNIWLLWLQGSGHTVPEYKPVEALDFYKRFLAGIPIWERNKKHNGASDLLYNLLLIIMMISGCLLSDLYMYSMFISVILN